MTICHLLRVGEVIVDLFVDNIEYHVQEVPGKKKKKGWFGNFTFSYFKDHTNMAKDYRSARVEPLIRLA